MSSFRARVPSWAAALAAGAVGAAGLTACADSTRLSAPGSDCSVRGTEVVYDESIDANPNALDGGRV